MEETFVHEAAHASITKTPSIMRRPGRYRVEGVGERTDVHEAAAIEATNRYRVKRYGADAWQRLEVRNCWNCSPRYYGGQRDKY